LACRLWLWPNSNQGNPAKGEGGVVELLAEAVAVGLGSAAADFCAAECRFSAWPK